MRKIIISVPGIRCYLVTGILFVSFLMSSCYTPKENAQSTKNSNPNGRNDKWSLTGYGGGGAMFFPAVSPFNADFAFVACDMTGTFVTYNGGQSWRMFCLHGPVKYFVFDPVDSNIVYAKSIALFKSTDRGNTWNILYPGPSEIKGIVAKGDHAEEIIITNDSTRRNVLAMAVDPGNSKKLYAAISINKTVGFYSSNDQGSNWTQETELEDGAKNIFVDPSSAQENRTLIITGKSSLSVRENGVWITNPGPLNVASLTEFTGGFNKKNNKYIVYAISGKSYFNPDGDLSGIFFTDDGGKTWQNRQDGLLKMRTKNADFPEWRSIATSALHPEVVYVSYDRLKTGNDTTCIGVAKSEDFGKTWELAWKDRLTKPVDLYSENYNRGWLDKRFGPTWGENPFSIGVSPKNPDIVYASDFGRTIKTINGGKTWEQVYTKKKEGGGWISRGLDVTTGYNIVFDPFDITHVFIANTDIGLMESIDGGESWTSATKDNGVPHAWANSTYWLCFDPAVKGKAWAAMSDVHDLPRPKMFRRNGVTGYEGGVLVTEDGGKSWKPVSRDIGEAAIVHILVDEASSKDSRILYACAFGKGVYKSIDGGNSWKQMNKGINGKEPFAWRIIKNDKNGNLFLIVNRRSDDGSIGDERDGAVYLSENGAESWTKLTLPDGVNGPTCLVIDPENNDKLLLSAWGRSTEGLYSPDEGGGIFLSNDKAISWKQVLKKDQHIHDLTFDPRNNTFYACGFTGSAYRSEDQGETWIRIKGYNFKWGKRVEPDPENPEMVYIITFGGGVWHGPAKGDENALEDIVNPLFNY
jgi:photosystem II stability/assembly factor-like uncharacterized protein